MEKQEFETKFNELISSTNVDPIMAQELRSAVLGDYDIFSTAQTSITAFDSKIKELTAENEKYRDTNMRLIMMNPELIGKPENKPVDKPEDEPVIEDNNTPTIEDVLKELRGE